MYSRQIKQLKLFSSKVLLPTVTASVTLTVTGLSFKAAFFNKSAQISEHKDALEKEEMMFKWISSDR